MRKTFWRSKIFGAILALDKRQTKTPRCPSNWVKWVRDTSRPCRFHQEGHWSLFPFLFVYRRHFRNHLVKNVHLCHVQGARRVCARVSFRACSVCVRTCTLARLRVRVCVCVMLGYVWECESACWRVFVCVCVSVYIWVRSRMRVFLCLCVCARAQRRKRERECEREREREFVCVRVCVCARARALKIIFKSVVSDHRSVWSIPHLTRALSVR